MRAALSSQVVVAVLVGCGSASSHTSASTGTSAVSTTVHSRLFRAARPLDGTWAVGNIFAQKPRFYLLIIDSPRLVGEIREYRPDGTDEFAITAASTRHRHLVLSAKVIHAVGAAHIPAHFTIRVLTTAPSTDTPLSLSIEPITDRPNSVFMRH